MPKRKSSKKSRITIERDGNEVDQVFDYGKFKTMFEKWKSDCDKSGEEIRMKTNSNTLLDVVASHGKTHRPQTKNKQSIGAGDIVKQLQKLISNAEELETADVTFIEKAIEQLKEVEKKNNPRNILFTIPIFGRVNRKTLEFDDSTDVEKVYGHYRTPDYIKFRNLKAKLRENVDKETMPAAPSTWYDKDKNKSKPPLWQAMFADGDGDVVSHGLLTVLNAGLDLTEGVKLEHLKLRIRDSGKGVTAKDLWSIPQVQKWVKNVVGNTNSLGTGINKSTGNFRDTHISNTLSSVVFPVQSIRDSNFIKDLAEHEDTVGQLVTYSIIITRRQMRNLAVLSGCKRRPGKDTVYMPGVGPKEKKGSDTKKMDWKGILKSW